MKFSDFWHFDPEKSQSQGGVVVNSIIDFFGQFMTFPDLLICRP